jgi:hypothetical protein
MRDYLDARMRAGQFLRGICATDASGQAATACGENIDLLALV